MTSAIECLQAKCIECLNSLRWGYDWMAKPGGERATLQDVLACECRRCPLHPWRDGKGGVDEHNARVGILRFCRESPCSGCLGGMLECPLMEIMKTDRRALQVVRAANGL